MKRLIIKDKLGQSTFSLPYGVIFSIILIIVFIVVTFIVVRHFLDLGSCGQIGKFYDNLQKQVNDAYSSQSSEFDFDVSLPSRIEKICFADFSNRITNQEDYSQIEIFSAQDANVFLLPIEKACNMEYKLIQRINITETAKNENPYCVSSSEKLRIKKGFYDKYVVIE